MLKILKSEEEYEKALAQAYQLMQQDLEEGNEKSDELEFLTLLIEHYEKQHYPI